MAKIILFNKPYGVLSQFTGSENEVTLSKYIKEKGFYPAGRLDKDSEGLLILTDNGQLQHRISHPNHKLPKCYWVQVEGEVNEEALHHLRTGVDLKDGKTKPAKASVIASPNIWERTPPIRKREHIPSTWLALTLSEGKNRQVRRMTAAVGIPTLRLIRYSIGSWNIDNISNGTHKTSTIHAPQKTFMRRYKKNS